MKKIIIIILVSILLLAAVTSILVPFTESKKDPGETKNPIELDLLTELGAKTYYTGTANFKATSEKPITIDGMIDESEPWVCVTSKNVNATPITSFMDYTSNKGWQGKVDLALQTAYDARYICDVKYYVAQSDDSVYLALREVSPFVDLDDSGTFNDKAEGVGRSNYYYRIGFNNADYSQQLVFGCTGANPIYLGISDSDVFFDTHYDVMKASSMSSYKYDEENDTHGAFHSYGNDNKNLSDLTGRWIAYTEFQFDKAAIKEAYKEAFDIELTDKDFESMYVGLSSNTFKGGDELSGVIRPIYGTFVSDAVSTYGLPSRFIPDKIVFGKK